MQAGFGRAQRCGPGSLLLFVVEVAVAFFHGIREVDQVEEIDLGIFRHCAQPLIYGLELVDGGCSQTWTILL